MRLAGLELDHLIHDVLPRPRADLLVSRGEVGAGNLQIHRWLLLGLIARMEQPQRCGAVFRFETFLFAGYVIVNVITPGLFSLT